jgi:hypothetical protein
MRVTLCDTNFDGALISFRGRSVRIKFERLET